MSNIQNSLLVLVLTEYNPMKVLTLPLMFEKSGTKTWSSSCRNVWFSSDPWDRKVLWIFPNFFDLFVQIQEKVLIWVHIKLCVSYQFTQSWVDTSLGTCKMTLDRWNLIVNSRMSLADGNASALKLSRTKMKAIDSNILFWYVANLQMSDCSKYPWHTYIPFSIDQNRLKLIY